MVIRFRRSKKVGPLNFTVSKSGLSVSAGAAPIRVRRSANGRKTISARTGIPGLSYRKNIK